MTSATSSACPHHERGGGGDLIRETDDADLKFSAKQIGPSAQIDQRWKAGGANRDARCSLTPRTSEAVVDHHREINSGQRCQTISQRRRAAVRILRQQKHALGAVRWSHIRLVHPGVRHDEAKPVLNNQHVAARPHDTNGLRQDDLDEPRVLVDLRCERASFGGGFDGRKVDHAILGLRDDLLRDDKHVLSPRLDAVLLETRGDQFDQVVASLDQGQAVQGNDLERGHALLRVSSGAPYRRRRRGRTCSA